MTPIEFRGNIGSPIQVLYFANGVAVEQDCTSVAGGQARLRSTAEDGTGSAFGSFLTPATLPGGINPGQTPVFVDNNGPADVFMTADPDFDVNQIVFLNAPLAAGARITQGVFSHSSLAQNLSTGVFQSNIGIASPQGDCVMVGTINRD